jgi:hypothetical protein
MLNKFADILNEAKVANDQHEIAADNLSTSAINAYIDAVEPVKPSDAEINALIKTFEGINTEKKATKMTKKELTNLVKSSNVSFDTLAK